MVFQYSTGRFQLNVKSLYFMERLARPRKRSCRRVVGGLPLVEDIVDRLDLVNIPLFMARQLGTGYL